MEETNSGNYIVVFDPIDGSSNIDIALTTGSIFGIYGPDEQCLVDLDANSEVNIFADFQKKKISISDFLYLLLISFKYFQNWGSDS